LRISYAGGGTDLEPFLSDNGGSVINSAINQFAYCTVEPWHSWYFVSNDLNKDKEYLWEPTDYDHSATKLLVNSFLFLKEKFDLPETPIKITTTSDVSPGSGLGSSSAITVSILTALIKFFQVKVSDYELCEYSFYVERELCNLPGGKQDQYASVYGGLKKYNFNRDKTDIENMHISPDFKNTLNVNTVLYNVGSPRPDANTIFNLSDNVITDNIKNLEKNNTSISETIKLKKNCELMKEAMQSKNIKSMAHIFNQNWQIKKIISPTITTDFLEEVYEVALANGAMGAKICGAGGGGHVIFLVDINDRARLIKKLNSLAGKVVPFIFYEKGAESWKM
jgi:D-glycero-alpha-D-manno-heptose-7-phosphate kinase